MANIQRAREMVEVSLADEIELSYALYTFYTIRDRALPDVVDGLKPVQRRIMYVMYKMGLKPNKSSVKSATITGEVMGKYHPHGDASIYLAMVRMAQRFMMSQPLIYGQGNFGYPGAGPAAPRYTKAKLSAAGQMIVEELADNVVEMLPTYDNTREEPTVLPAKFPVLLVNGATGIAVAMATNMAPHNPREVMKATIWQLKNQEMWKAVEESREGTERREKAISDMVDELVKIMPGPDFPLNCDIVGVDGAKKAYNTGSGKVIMRARYNIERGTSGSVIKFSNIPYGTSPAAIAEYLAEQEKKFVTSTRILKENGGKGDVEGFQIAGVTDINDYSDAKNDVSLEVNVDARTNPEVVVAEMFKRTALESSFSFNNNCLVNGVPRVMSLPEIIQHFLDFRRDVMVRRNSMELEKKESRHNLVMGLLSVMLDIDKAISIIRESDDQTVANAALKKHFKLQDGQAKYVLDLPLRRLTKLEDVELNAEREELEADIAKIKEILTNPSKRDEMLLQELEDVSKVFHDDPTTEARSRILDTSLKDAIESSKEALSMDRELEDEEVTVGLDSRGKVVRGRRVAAASVHPLTTLGNSIVVTSTGRGVRVPVCELLDKQPPPHLLPDERAIALLSEDGMSVVATKNGVVFSFQPNYPTRVDDFELINLADGDEVVAGAPYDENGVLVFVSSQASVLVTKAKNVTPKQTLGGKGMAGMKLPAGATVVSFASVNDAAMKYSKVATMTDETLKVTPLTEFPDKGRNTGGVRGHRFTKSESGELKEAFVGDIALKGGAAKGANSKAYDGKRDGSGIALDGVKVGLRL